MKKIGQLGIVNSHKRFQDNNSDKLDLQHYFGKSIYCFIAWHNIDYCFSEWNCRHFRFWKSLGITFVLYFLLGNNRFPLETVLHDRITTQLLFIIVSSFFIDNCWWCLLFIQNQRRLLVSGCGVHISACQLYLFIYIDFWIWMPIFDFPIIFNRLKLDSFNVIYVNFQLILEKLSNWLRWHYI